MNFLPILDIFGVEFKQQIQLNVKAQKSTIGGITSILIMAASFAYLIYVFLQWINFELLPKSSNNQKVEELSTLFYDENEYFFQFLYWKNQANQIDPFTPTDNILIPLLLCFENGTLVETIKFLNQTQEISSYGTLKYGLKQLKLSQNFLANSSQLYVREVMLVLIKCNQTFLSEGQFCASEEKFQEFFQSYSNFILFRMNLKEFNQATQQFEVVRKSHFIPLDSAISTQGQIFIKQTHAYIDTGMLLGSVQEESFVQEAQLLTFSTQTSFWQQMLGEKCYLCFGFRLDPISTELRIVYPKLGEVLAQVGSIANLLLLLKFLVLYYNEKILEDYFTDQILGFYFLNFFDVKKQEKNKHKELYKTLTDQAKQKLVYINIIYELSRIQLFLQAQFGRDKLNQSHKLGIKLINVEQGQKHEMGVLINQSERVINPEIEDKFLVEDFFLFSQPKLVQVHDILNSQKNT